jgi:hypothetical protein
VRRISSETRDLERFIVLDVIITETFPAKNPFCTCVHISLIAVTFFDAQRTYMACKLRFVLLRLFSKKLENNICISAVTAMQTFFRLPGFAIDMLMMVAQNVQLSQIPVSGFIILIVMQR